MSREAQAASAIRLRTQDSKELQRVSAQSVEPPASVDVDEALAHRVERCLRSVS